MSLLGYFGTEEIFMKKKFNQVLRYDFENFRKAILVFVEENFKSKD